jgi:hypothetical protein
MERTRERSGTGGGAGVLASVGPRSRRFGKSLVCLVALVCLLGVSPRLAADEDTAKARYIIACAVMLAKGYTQTRFEDVGKVAEGRAVIYTVFLNRGVGYALFATKDQNIDNLEVLITDEEGNILEHSSPGEWGSALFFTPTWTGTYKAYVQNTRGNSGWYMAAVAF